MAESGQTGNRIVSLTILGEPASKANSRRLVTIGGRPRFIKSQKALDYIKSLKEQVKPLPTLISGPIHVDLEVYYASLRPDLDESVILDALQGLIYENDRQVVSKHVVRGLSKTSPRSHVHVTPLEGLPLQDVHRRDRPAEADQD